MFFNEQGMLALDEVVAKNESWRKIMADGIVTAEELTEQANCVLSLLQNLEEKLTEEEKQIVEDLLVETSVLFAANHVYQLQELKF